MYGLKQAAILAYKQLVRWLKTQGYHPIPTSNGLWKYMSRPALFELCVDDFGVKYNSTEDLQHLISTLKSTTK